MTCVSGSYAAPTPAADTAVRGRKILVVDDEPMIRKFIESSLRAGGYEEVIFGTNGGCVPKLALQESPQLIIMDVMMPGGNGMRAYRNLKSTSETAGIPVIMTSGFNVMAVDANPENPPGPLLPKPFTAGRLLEEVNRAFAATV